MKLSLGSGLTNLGPEWIHIDKDPGVNPDLCLKIGEQLLDYAPGEVEEIYCSHLLEHFGYTRVSELLQTWVKWLRPRGILWLAVPDASILTAQALTAQRNLRWDVWHDCMRHLFAWQRDPEDTHRYGYCEETLRALMAFAGLTKISRFEPWADDSTRNACVLGCGGERISISLNLKGEKP